MKNLLSFLFFSFLFVACNSNLNTSSDSVQVDSKEALYKALKNPEPGTTITLKDGIYEDVQIRLTGEGTKDQPITLKSETEGGAIITGASDIKLGGSYLYVDGIYFKDGHSPSNAVIEFRINSDSLAYHSKITNCVIKDYNQANRSIVDIWVQFHGRHNSLDHCYLAGKSNKGPTVRVNIKGNESIKNYHEIVNNHFGPRPRKGGPSAETIQIGDSYTSMSPSYTLVADNLFEYCNGEVEVISSKTNFNEFRNNVFYKSEGSLVTRHGNYCTIDGNYFIGDDNSDNIGGIRIINTGHWVTNNYFYNLQGSSFRSPLAVMNGIPKSPQNRYNQVTDVVVAYNTWINCKSPLQFGVGTNISQKDVLPLSEIRSAVPIRTTVANNLIFNTEGDPTPIVAHDKISKIKFKNNLINNQGIKFEENKGLKSSSFEVKEVGDKIFLPSTSIEGEVYVGFDFETIEKDIFGQIRKDNNSPGASIKAPSKVPNLLNKSAYGPAWYSDEAPKEAANTIKATAQNLAAKIKEAVQGDIILLSNGTYALDKSIAIDKKITIKTEGDQAKATINFQGPKGTPAFELHPNGHLILEGINLSGNNQNYAFATKKEGMSSLYNLTITNSEISDFDYVLKAYKHSFSDEINLTGTTVRDCKNGLELSEETDDKGDYNVEFLNISNCKFTNVAQNVVDYYRGGYDESTIGGNLSITGSVFTNCGQKEENGILINTRGIINVDISDNEFSQNKVKLVALLWGAKNNTHSNNKTNNSGEIRVEENLKLKLFY